MSDPTKPDSALTERLARLEAALATAPTPKEVRPEKRGRRRRSPSERGGRAVRLGIALMIVAAATGRWTLMAPAAFLIVVGGLFQFDRLASLVLHNVPAGLVTSDPTQARIGMGATIAADAVIEPGATVEMGASVASGAIVRQGAVVRMGSSVAAGAVIEAAAIVSWGSSVGQGAIVGAGATVGAGCSVGAGVSVPPGMKLMAGVDWDGGVQSALAPGRTAADVLAPVAQPLAPVDPREARVEAACEKLKEQLASAPEAFREVLGDPVKTVQTLRQTCHALLKREAALRAESRPERLAELENERTALTHRLESQSDPMIQRSLSGAVAAIDDQLSQRRVLARNADRLDAEVTRLIFTLEGMGAQLVRMQSAGADLAAEGAGVGASLQSLHDEVDALVGALEEMAHPEPAGSPLTPVVDIGAEGTVPSGQRDRA